MLGRETSWVWQERYTLVYTPLYPWWPYYPVVYTYPTLPGTPRGPPGHTATLRTTAGKPGTGANSACFITNS